MEKRFNPRYEDTFHWIKTKILAGSKKGILNLIFWRLPLIFIEGKVVAAFFHRDSNEPEKGPLLDTIRIPESKKIFKYKSFIESFQKAVGREKFSLWEVGRNNKTATYHLERKMANPDAPFDFLDYFGIPCKIHKDTGKTYYNCLFFSFECFDGFMEIWVALSKENEEALWNSYHEKKLREFVDRIDKTMKEEKIDYTEDVLAGHVLKHDIMPSVFKSRENVSDLSNHTIELSEYLISAFSVLHESLLDSLNWKENPCRLFILVNSRLFSPKLRFFLTKDQKKDYKKKYNEHRRTANNENKEPKQVEEVTKHVKSLRKEKGGNDTLDVDKACTIMEKTEQSGTVSSLFKQRGFYELFLEATTFNAHPVLFKKEVIKRDWPRNQYSYPEELEAIEPLFLLTLPNVEENNAHASNKAGEAEYQFAMIPYFFRGHPFGCIAFFNPKLITKEEWYGYLTKVLNILDEKEGTIYQAAIKDLCQNIFEVVEGFENE